MLQWKEGLGVATGCEGCVKLSISPPTTAPTNPPNNGDIGVGRLLEIIVPIPTPAIEP